MTDAAQAPHIVRELTVGNTRIKIADNCCRGKGAEEIKNALRDIARAAQASISAAAVVAQHG